MNTVKKIQLLSDDFFIIAKEFEEKKKNVKEKDLLEKLKIRP